MQIDNVLILNVLYFPGIIQTVKLNKLNKNKNYFLTYASTGKAD